ncbi:winged helix DNA-binding domain-containing protein [Microbacterium sp. NPDC056234]|uniref:winged helix DNA-binding domain-containing protein n=1 Tax=Microbacterium sp. NPDC056234 TaxID=3345757 RepID=UPI0035D747F6
MLRARDGGKPDVARCTRASCDLIVNVPRASVLPRSARLTPMMEMLGQRALNRATLTRQLLMQRSDRTVQDAVEHLVGLQAQTPHSWYVGLWSRLADFRPEHAAELLIDRRLVRIALMRSTIHLVTAPDAMALRPLVQPALDRDLYANGTHGRPIRGVDVASLTAAGRAVLAERPMTAKEVGERLGTRWPDVPPATLAYALRNLVPLVQVPPRGLWGRSGPIAHTTAEAWLGSISAPELTLPQLVLRYLASFGPATVADMQRWSGLTRLREIVDGMPQLKVFRGEEGQELFDLPDAPRPDPETPVPPRFLYDFDNLLLSHADRTRIITDDFHRHSHRPHGPVPSVLLIDGVTGGDWTITRSSGAATLRIRTYAQPSESLASQIAAEGRRLLAFTDPEAEDPRVEFARDLFD